MEGGWDGVKREEIPSSFVIPAEEESFASKNA